MNSFPYPSMRDRFDLRFYFVVGPDDCGNRPILDVVAKALDGGASFIQLRAKTQDVAEIVSLANDIAEEIARFYGYNNIPCTHHQPLTCCW